LCLSTTYTHHGRDCFLADLVAGSDDIAGQLVQLAGELVEIGSHCRLKKLDLTNPLSTLVSLGSADLCGHVRVSNDGKRFVVRADEILTAFIELEGVTDAWIEGLPIEKLAGGQIPDDQAIRLAAELSTIGTPDKIATCCAPASKVAPRPGVVEKSTIAEVK